MVEGGPSRDFAKVKRWAAEDQTGFAALIDRLVQATAIYLKAQIAAGAEAIQIFDSWAGVLEEPEFARWVIEPTRRIAAALKKEFPAVPLIGFPRGAGTRYERYAAESGVDAVSLDTAVPLDWAREKLQARMPVQGNLHPALVVAGGDPMTRAIAAIKRALGGGPFVFNLGHGILPETPPAHVAALVAAVRDAGAGS
jgi:uroporphyrinogen decarboxylase